MQSHEVLYTSATSLWQHVLYWQELQPTVEAGDLNRTGGGFYRTTRYNTSDFIRVKGLANDLMCSDQQHHN